MKSLSSVVMPPCDSSRLQCDNWSHLERQKSTRQREKWLHFLAFAQHQYKVLARGGC